MGQVGPGLSALPKVKDGITDRDDMKGNCFVHEVQKRHQGRTGTRCTRGAADLH